MNVFLILLSYILLFQASNSSVAFEKHDGKQCEGSSDDVLRDFEGDADECKQKCLELDGCVGFVRVNDGSNAGKCYFRGGELSDPEDYTADDRDCYAPVPLFKKFAGKQCEGSTDDIERDFEGDEEDCKEKCVKLDGCVGFIRVNDGSNAGKCYFRGGSLKDPEEYTADDRDCYVPASYKRYDGMQCDGSEEDIERDYEGEAGDCKKRCMELDECAGFVRVNSGTNAGKCFFRGGTLQDPEIYTNDERDCYEPVTFRKYEGKQCEGSEDDILRDFEGDAEQCKEICLELEGCIGFIRVNDGANGGKCFFRGGTLKDPVEYTADNRDCYVPVPLSGRTGGSLSSAARYTGNVDDGNVVQWTSVAFEKYDGMQCEGSEDDVFRDFEGNAEECKLKCLATDGCVGFVRVNTGQYAGKCYLRGGTLKDPVIYTADDRDCYIPAPLFKKFAGQQCEGSADDVLREFEGDEEECKEKCLRLEGCVGFVRVNDGQYGGKCYFRGGTLKDPVTYTADSRDCYVPVSYKKYDGSQCNGSEEDVEREYEAEAGDCKVRCMELDECAGFVRVNTGTYGGKCYFRGGTLQDPEKYTNDERDCYEPVTFRKYEGKQCEGSANDVLRDFEGDVEKCKQLCLELEECAGFIRVNDGTYGGKCFFRGGTLKDPVEYTSDNRDCYEPVTLSGTGKTEKSGGADLGIFDSDALYKKFDGMQCDGSSDDVLRDYQGDIEECMEKCDDLDGCVGFVRVNDGQYAGKCFFRGGTLGDPVKYTADDRDCYVPVGYKKYDGMQCIGSREDVERDYEGDVDECKERCMELDGCSGFIRVNTGTYAGKCFFRGGRLSNPEEYTDDDRDCYEPVTFKKYEGMQCEGSEDDVLRDYEGDVRECGDKCLETDGCVGFVRVNDGEYAGKCYLRGGTLKDPYKYTADSRDCYDPVLVSGRKGGKAPSAKSAKSASNTVGNTYSVLVSNARDLIDEDTDFLWITNKNDVYVQVYGETGDPSKVKVETTSVINGNTEPEWKETFIFDDVEDGNGAYTQFVFKLYDSDQILGFNIFEDDFLGETAPFLVSSISECDTWYSEQMTVTRDNNECGSLFVSFSKECP